MKLLFDQNLSPGLVRRLEDIFPESAHVYLMGLDQAEDIEISHFAFKNNFVIVTKDADYSEMLSLKEHLPKIVWIRKGNCTTDAIHDLLRENAQQIIALAGSQNVRLLVLF